MGRENCAEFEKELKRQNITYKALYADGKIRENITLHLYMDKETRISLDSFEMSVGTLKALFDLIEKDTDGGTVVAFSGRLPRGISEETAAQQLLRLKEKGARLAIDCNSLSIDTLKRIRPWFIKPNEQEVEAFFGRPVQNAREAADFALELVRCGSSEQVMISLVSSGCAFADGQRRFTVSVPKIEVKSTIGAGDSTVAGFIAAIQDGLDTESALAFACACGSAACLTHGTNPPKKEDTEKLLEKITVCEL